MQFVLSIFRNLLVAAAFALLSAVLYRPPKREDAQPSDFDFKPTAREGTEVPQLFGTGPVQFTIVGVMDEDNEAIRR